MLRIDDVTLPVGWGGGWLRRRLVKGRSSWLKETNGRGRLSL